MSEQQRKNLEWALAFLGWRQLYSVLWLEPSGDHERTWRITNDYLPAYVAELLRAQMREKWSGNAEAVEEMGYLFTPLSDAHTVIAVAVLAWKE